MQVVVLALVEGAVVREPKVGRPALPLLDALPERLHLRRGQHVLGRLEVRAPEVRDRAAVRAHAGPVAGAARAAEAVVRAARRARRLRRVHRLVAARAGMVDPLELLPFRVDLLHVEDVLVKAPTTGAYFVSKG